MIDPKLRPSSLALAIAGLLAIPVLGNATNASAAGQLLSSSAQNGQGVVIEEAATPGQESRPAPKADRGELERQVKAMKKAVQNRVKPEEIERRLRGRTPKYRSVKIADTGEAPKEAKVEEKKAPAIGQATPNAKKSRLLGDAEKKGLDNVFMLVDGLPVTTAEIDALAEYFGTYQPGGKTENRKAAIQELLIVRGMEAKFRGERQKLLERINALHAKATQDGADFAEIAKKNSDCPSASQGGDLSFFGRKPGGPQMVPSFAKRAFTLSVGQVSEVFATQFGYHFLKVTGKKEGKTRADDQVRASHVLVLFTKDTNQLQSMIQEIMSGAADVAVHTAEDRKLLPLNYQ